MTNIILFIEFDFPHFPIYKFIFIGLFIFSLLRLLKFIVPVFKFTRKNKTFINKISPFGELLVWVLFFAWALQYFADKNQFLAGGLFLVLLSISIWASWFILKDYITGLIFRRETGLSINRIISTGDVTGKIKQFKSRTLVIETQAGKTIHLPYSKVLNNKIEKLNPAETISGHTFILELKSENEIEKIIPRIKETIMYLPWASIKREPDIKPISTENQKIKFEITVYALEKGFFYKIENFVKKTFAL